MNLPLRLLPIRVELIKSLQHLDCAIQQCNVAITDNMCDNNELQDLKEVEEFCNPDTKPMLDIEQSILTQLLHNLQSLRLGIEQQL